MRIRWTIALLLLAYLWTQATAGVAPGAGCPPIHVIQTVDEQGARQSLTAIAEALAHGDTKGLQRYFSGKVFLTLPTGENGYYSGEQSFFILRNFLSVHTPFAFEFTTTNVSSESVYGVGALKYTKRGQRGTAQVFVSLAASDRGWRINQITIAQR